MYKDRNFRCIAVSQFISDLGNWFYTIAISTLVYSLTESAMALSMTIVTSLIPAAVFSMIGGGISDKFDAKKLMIGSDLIRCFVVLLTFFAGAVKKVLKIKQPY